MNKYPEIPIALLSDVIAQLVQFARDDYQMGIMPQECMWNIGYIVSCMLAQHTPEGDSGVDTEIGYMGMAVDKDMPYTERLALAKALVVEWSTP